MHLELALISRAALLLLQAMVAASAVVGGFALALGAYPPVSYLAGSPLSSYLIPALLLIVVLGGSHTLATILVLRRSEWGWPVSATAVFEAAAIAEIGAALTGLGLLDVLAGTVAGQPRPVPPPARRPDGGRAR